ncbi:AroQ 3-dehydroquinate dehydratase II [Candidatus Methylopumilus universalis]|uniref:type II 3-dehydroquinate dehydratase n=1 Tax=Candidatus Methylopumilus universalis TaxID=2588536 RepID=UPI003BEF3FD5
MATKSILVLHGPNLNLLGEREPQHYGKQTLEDIDQALKTIASAKSIKLETMQSNSEGDLVNIIQSLHNDKVDFLIINPAAYTHTSVAMRDALSAVKVPFIEVHLSNVYAREPFRHHSYFSDIAVAVISGLGAEGYIAALNFAINA